MSWPFDEDEHMMQLKEFMTLGGHFEQLTFQRDELVHTFTTLAQFGAQAATGEFFIWRVKSLDTHILKQEEMTEVLL